MIQDNIVVEVERRHETGKNAANRLRAADQIPAVIYGGGKGMETLPLKVPRKSLVGLLRKGMHENTIFKLHLKGTDQQRHVMIRDMAVDPVSRALLHVDFVRILLDRKLRVAVPVACEGIAVGVKNEGGLLNVVTHELEIECLPADIPPAIRVDVSHLHAHEAVRVSDLSLGERIRLLEAPDRVVVHVGMPRAEEVPAAATAAPAEGAAEAPVEPEVIKKGKKETEETAAEPAKAEKGEKGEMGERGERGERGDKAEKKEKK
jgi:large subunit ribosomal protein L25